MQNGTWALVLSDQERLSRSCELQFASCICGVINIDCRSTTVRARECAYTLGLCAAFQEVMQLA